MVARAVDCNLVLVCPALPCPSLRAERPPPSPGPSTFGTGLGLFSHLCSWQVACSWGWPFLGGRICLNFILPLVKWAADGHEAGGETPHGKTKAECGQRWGSEGRRLCF